MAERIEVTPAADLSGTDKLHLGCGEDYREEWHNVDYVESVDPDEVVDLNAYPWPWDAGQWSLVVAEHVFEHLDDIEDALRETARILKPGGTLRVVLPMGVNARADPDHKHEWTWQTPEFYTGARHWDTDVGLTVVDKTVRMHSLHRGWLSSIHEAAWAWQLARYGPGEWCFSLPAMSGEFQVVFRK